MWLFFAVGALCRLRKHGSNRPRLAGKLKYFCDSSVIYKLAGQRGCDTARMNDHGLSYFEDYLLGATYECGSVSIDQASIIAFAKEFDPQPFHVDPVAAAAGPYGGLIARGWANPLPALRPPAENYLAAAPASGAPGRYAPCPGHGCRVPSVGEQTRPRHRQDRGGGDQHRRRDGDAGHRDQLHAGSLGPG